MKLKGKTGQERKDGKKEGGVMFNLDIPQEEVEKLLKGIFTEKRSGKLAQAMFAYGMTSKVQEEVGYVIPGSEEWKEEGEAELYKWTEQDTQDYLDALNTYDALPTTRSGPSIEERQKTWDEKKAKLEATNQALPEELRLDITLILGKRPEAKK